MSDQNAKLSLAEQAAELLCLLCELLHGTPMEWSYSEDTELQVYPAAFDERLRYLREQAR